MEGFKLWVEIMLGGVGFNAFQWRMSRGIERECKIHGHSGYSWWRFELENYCCNRNKNYCTVAFSFVLIVCL
jgi:hypothetical protein